MIGWAAKLLGSPIAWAAGAIVAGYLYGQHVGTVRCEAAMAEAEASIRAHYADEINRILEDANARIAAVEAEITALETEVADYEQEIDARPDVCRLDDADAARLQSIR